MVYNFYFFQANNPAVEEILKVAVALALVEETVDLVEAMMGLVQEMVVPVDRMAALGEEIAVPVEEIVEEIEVFVQQLHFLQYEKK